jgi:hypothetical protein
MLLFLPRETQTFSGHSGKPDPKASSGYRSIFAVDSLLYSFESDERYFK